VSAIDLWWFRIDGDDAVAARAAALLDPGERARHDAFAFPDPARAFAIRRAARRAILGHHTGTPPAMLAFEGGEGERPRLRGRAAPLFSASSAGPVGLLAVAEAGVFGVDIEVLRDIDHAALARRIMAPEDLAALARLPLAARPARVIADWSAKEALLKARGLGLDLDAMRAIRVDHDALAGGWARVDATGPSSAYRGWNVWLAPPPADTGAAGIMTLAAPHPVEIRVRAAAPILAPLGIG
jgi:4'-phosphopantetheinyl transferase